MVDLANGDVVLAKSFNFSGSIVFFSVNGDDNSLLSEFMLKLEIKIIKLKIMSEKKLFSCLANRRSTVNSCCYYYLKKKNWYGSGQVALSPYTTVVG